MGEDICKFNDHHLNLQDCKDFQIVIDKFFMITFSAIVEEYSCYVILFQFDAFAFDKLKHQKTSHKFLGRYYKKKVSKDFPDTI